MATKTTAKASDGAAAASTELASTSAAPEPEKAAQDPNAGLGGLYRRVNGQRVLVERTKPANDTPQTA
jgi:hypothetical protein